MNEEKRVEKEEYYIVIKTVLETKFLFHSVGFLWKCLKEVVGSELDNNNGNDIKSFSFFFFLSVIFRFWRLLVQLDLLQYHSFSLAYFITN